MRSAMFIDQFAKVLIKAVSQDTLARVANDLLFADDNEKLADWEANRAQELLNSITRLCPEIVDVCLKA